MAGFALLVGAALLFAATAGRSSQASARPIPLSDNVPPAAASLRQLCSFANGDAHAAKIQGADGGSSVLVGDKSYWLFGDTLLLPESGRQIQANALASSNTRSADGCPVLEYYSQAGAAAQFLQKDGSLTVWPSGAWPVDDHTFDFYTVYIYGSGPFAYRIGEVGLAQLDTRTMEVQTLSRSLWSAESGFARQVIGAQPVELGSDGLLRIILGTHDGDQLLARVAPQSLAVAGAYEFWDGGGWSSDPGHAKPLWTHIEPSSDPVQRLATFNNGVNIAYNAYIGKYVAVQNVSFDKIGARVADQLEGPWSEPTVWVDCSTLAGPAVPVCYSPYQHPELSSADGRTVVLTFTRTASYDVVAYEITLGASESAVVGIGLTATSTPTPLATRESSPSPSTSTPTSALVIAQATSTPEAANAIATGQLQTTPTPPVGTANPPVATTSAIPTPPSSFTAVTSASGPDAAVAALATGSIAGKVTNALGTPIAGANVWACCYYGGGTTAADGTYIITGLAPGSYVVPVFASGYATTLYNGTYDFTTAVMVPVTSGVTTPNINFALVASANISGKVTNALGTPIAGANVQACPKIAGYCGGATSAADGSYIVSDLAPGAYDVYASAPSYVLQYYSGTPDFNAATLVSATSGNTTPNINFALIVGGSIAGKVTNTLGTPIAGANVNANLSGCCGGGGATTAADGTYLITGLAAGSYRVQASGPYCPSGATSPPCVSYVSQYYNGTLDYNAATLVPVTSGNTTPNVNFALIVGGSIAGKVTNTLGTPIAGASVNANLSGCCGGGGTTTALDGTYLITGLAAGSYRLGASGPSCPAGPTSPPCVSYVYQYYNGTQDYSAATLVPVASAVTTPNINFALIVGGSIAGKVTNTLGTPIAGASVNANSSVCCSGGNATTAADGTYLITGLAAGSYRVHASSAASCWPISPPCVSYVSQYYNGTVDYSAATLVPVTAGNTTPNINFALIVAGSVAGKVTNALGTPIAGANVYASSSACCGYGNATTAADGTYLITGLAAGSYRVQASGPSCGPTSPPCVSYVYQYYNGTLDYNAATLVPVTSGNTTPNINFALIVGGSIAGKVTNTLGTPIAGASVNASSSACCGYGNATTAADGTYLITGLAAGSYRVQASGPYCPSGPTSPPCVSYVYQYYNGTLDYNVATLVPVTSGNTTPNVNFALILGGSIAGKVTNTLGTPIAGAYVSANTSGCCGSGYAQTAADGTYLMTGLAPAAYRVQASGPSCPSGSSSPPCVAYAARFYNGTYDFSAATLVPATSGVTTPNISFALAVGGSITGKITNPLGTPIAGAWVSADRNVGSGGGGFATSAADGTYVLNGLAPGSDVVSASILSCPPPSSPPAGGGCVPYPVWFYNGTCEYLSATPLAVTSGGMLTNINITLRPANPDCLEHALTVGGLPFTDTRSTAGATTAPGESLPCGNMGATVWYEYTAPASPAGYNTTSVDTIGSNFNTAVAIYSQGVSPPGVLALVACKSNASGSLVSFTPVPGMRYYFQIGGQQAATGQLTVNVSPDSDGDGYTDIQETRLGKNPLQYCSIMRADVDGDGAVSILDLTRVAQYFIQSIPPAPPRYDQDGDNKISILDLTRMAQVFIQPVSACP